MTQCIGHKQSNTSVGCCGGISSCKSIFGAQGALWKREGENVSLCTSDTVVTAVKLKIHVSQETRNALEILMMKLIGKLEARRISLKLMLEVQK